MLIDDYIVSNLDEIDASYDKLSSTFSRSSTHNSTMSLEDTDNERTSDLGSDIVDDKVSNSQEKLENKITGEIEKNGTVLRFPGEVFGYPRFDSSQEAIFEKEALIVEPGSEDDNSKNGAVSGIKEDSGSKAKRKGSDLMAILCGAREPQKTKLKQKAKANNMETDEIHENADNHSFEGWEEVVSLNSKEENSTMEHEKESVEGTKFVSVSDILNGFNQKPKTFFVTLSVPSLGRASAGKNPNKQSGNGPELLEHRSKHNDNEKNHDNDEVEVIDSVTFNTKAKTMSAKDILNLFGPQKSKKSPSNPPPAKLVVTLKISSDALREIKKFENPLKSRGNTGFAWPADPNRQTKTSFFDKCNSNSKSIFRTMMDASKTVSTHSAQASKVVEPPILKREQFHIHSGNDDDTVHANDYLEKLSLRSKKVTHDDNGKFIFPTKKRFGISDNIAQAPHTMDAKSLVLSRIPNITDIPELNYIYEKFVLKKESPNHALWSDLFQPSTINEVLIDRANQQSIKTWLDTSFEKLKSMPLKGFTSNIARQRKKNQSSNAELDGFIVDDDFDYTQEYSNEDEFVPILVIKGSTGSCKSASIYAAAKEINGYVYEINSGQFRGRKDILNKLREFSTTQLVHKQEESKKFQKGLILFEDVNILFEDDRKFWSVISEILTVSRRPIVLTCEHLLNFPKFILQVANVDNSFIDLDDKLPEFNLVSSFLWLCCVSQGYDLAPEIINDVIKTCSHKGINDIRKCLNSCQLLCQRSSSDNLVALRYGDSEMTPMTVSTEDSLVSIVQDLEHLSCSDLISTGSHSLLRHEIVENEFADVPYIDDSLALRQPSLPHELDIGVELESYTHSQKSEPLPLFSFNNSRDLISTFIGSRSKKISKLMEDIYYYGGSHMMRSTRSNVSPETVLYGGGNWIPDTTGVNDSSFIFSLPPGLLFSELAPYSRNWLSFQLSLNLVEQENIQQRGISIKKHISYRDFQDESLSLLQTFNYSQLYSILHSERS